jgi:tyrosyl-tRNA synthetase
MNPLIEGLDGRKMSSSWGNTISINALPNDMFGLVMSMRDDEVRKYFEYATRVLLEEVEGIMELHPKEAKMRLAREIVKIYHGEDKAGEAEEFFEKTFSKREIPTDIKITKASKDESLAEIMVREGVVASKSEFTRLEKAGAIEELENGVYRIGKHRFLKIERE